MTGFRYGPGRGRRQDRRGGASRYHRRQAPQAPISQTTSFWTTEVGEGFAVIWGEPGQHLDLPIVVRDGTGSIKQIRSVCPIRRRIGVSR